jgi:hypothetical protein
MANYLLQLSPWPMGILGTGAAPSGTRWPAPCHPNAAKHQERTGRHRPPRGDLVDIQFNTGQLH